jgi:3-hydroxybutyryl-CoA dehydrogenase
VVESLPVKEALFSNLGEIAKAGAVLATTTSSLPVIECAKASGRPADVVGMHFFNPAQVMKLVEVVSTISTAPDVAATAHAVSERWASTRSPAPTAPGSSSTRCCSRTSTTR